MTIRKAVIPVAGLGTRHFMHAVWFAGLKARDVTARPEGPGRITKISRGLQGRHNVIQVPALQAGGEFVGTRSRGFTPGYHMTGFQPSATDAPADFPAVPAAFEPTKISQT